MRLSNFHFQGEARDQSWPPPACEVPGEGGCLLTRKRALSRDSPGALTLDFTLWHCEE